jgi:tetratricopeptide (TPR) repeat protein
MPEPQPTAEKSCHDSRRPRRIVWIAASILFTTIAVALYFGRSLYDNWHTQRSKDFASQCLKLRQAKDWNQLATVAEQWKTWDKQSTMAILFRAEAAQELGDLQVAANLLSAVPPDSPKRLPALIERTTLLFGPLNQPQEGVRACREILEIEPRAFTAHQRLIYYYAITLQQEELLKQIYRSIELRSEPVEAYVYLMLADVLTFQNGFEVTNRWLSADTTEETFLVARTIHMWKGLSLEASPSEETKERLRLAERLLREYLDRYPQNLAVLSFFADLALNNGDVDELDMLLKRFPDSAENDSRYWRFKGWLFAARDQHAQAESAYRESLRIYPFSWPVRHELADILRRKQEFSQVATMQELALSGKALRKELMEIPDARSVPKSLLIKIRDYASRCGDDFVAEALAQRVRNLRD